MDAAAHLAWVKTVHFSQAAQEATLVDYLHLFGATGDPAHLAEAHEKLMFLRDHVGEQYQTSILENVPLHRDIVAAWKEHGTP